MNNSYQTDEEEEEEDDLEHEHYSKLCQRTTHVEKHEHRRKGHFTSGRLFQLHADELQGTVTDKERKDISKKEFLEKQKYLLTVMQQQQIHRKKGSHRDVGVLDNRPSTRTGISGYMVHRLEKGLPVEPLNTLTGCYHGNGGDNSVQLELSKYE